jgi:hypothetical protein
MKIIRKLIGLFIILFIVLPLMFGIIWTVGITKAAVSPDMVQKVPQMIISEVPDIIENSIERFKLNDINNKDSRRIIKAIKESGVSVDEFFDKSGLSKWLNTELSDSFYKIGEILKGNLSPEIIYLNMKPLKEALTADWTMNYIKRVFENLPVCNDEEMNEWENIIRGSDLKSDFPVCRYLDSNSVSSLIKRNIKNDMRDIPDKVEIFNPGDDFPIGLNISRLTISLSYILFLFPFLLLFLGSFIADSTKTGFLRWSGYSTLASGIIPLTTGYLLKDIIKITNNFFNVSVIKNGFDRIFYEDISFLTSKILDYLFTPVIKLSAVIVLIGVVIIGFSYILEKPEKIK